MWRAVDPPPRSLISRWPSRSRPASIDRDSFPIAGFASPDNGPDSPTAARRPAWRPLCTPKIARDRRSPESTWRGDQQHQTLNLKTRLFPAADMKILVNTIQYAQLAEQLRPAMSEGMA
jgi:hypothetical protein